MDGTARHSELLTQLRKHTTSKACLYIKRLSDIQLPILERILQQSYDHIKSRDGQMQALSKHKIGGTAVIPLSDVDRRRTLSFGFHTTLLHQGMVVVGLRYSFEASPRTDEVGGDLPTEPPRSQAATGNSSPRKSISVGRGTWESVSPKSARN
ncbi:MAG: hypothetical protein IPN71_08790 [Fibrobacteres bacterium]|nr:hypothetical protein [Fibrobacterota bacterium]